MLAFGEDGAGVVGEDIDLRVSRGEARGEFQDACRGFEVGDELVITLKGIRRIGAFKGEPTIPLANVRGVTADAGLPTGCPGFKKAPEWPGRKVLGTERADGCSV